MGGNNGHELALLDEAGRALGEAQSFEEIKLIRDKAEAVRKYAQSASLGLGIQNRAAEVKLRAERQAGKLLAQMSLRGGDRRSKNHRERLKLEHLGITRNQSTRWQLQAQVPDNVFQEHVKQTCEAGKELTSARLMRLAKQWHGARKAGAHTNGASRRNGRISRRRTDEPPSHPLAEMVNDLINHQQLLDNILCPIYSGQHAELTVADRRVMRYLLLEIQKVLGRLNKWQQTESRCTCRAQSHASWV